MDDNTRDWYAIEGTDEIACTVSDCYTRVKNKYEDIIDTTCKTLKGKPKRSCSIRAKGALLIDQANCLELCAAGTGLLNGVPIGG